MADWSTIQRRLRRRPRRWLVTGAAGFIGSHLVETLLRLNQRVIGLDNLATGHAENVEDVRSKITAEQRRQFRFLEADIRDAAACRRACRGADVVLHQAALGSVPRSLKDPLATNNVNVDGFLQVLWAARAAGVRRMVYASSSSVYGDHPTQPKREDVLGCALSPYAVSKRVNELYAGVFGPAYGMELMGLRYFNVFGPRQDPKGAYAAVIPRWILALLRGRSTEIYGDGKTSRDFCYVANVVQANLLAATTQEKRALGRIYNVAVHKRTTLKRLHKMLRDRLPDRLVQPPVYSPFREGDIRHSHADIGLACRWLGYQPSHTLEQGLDQTVCWFAERHG